jgi:voltage-gated sodium channel
LENRLAFAISSQVNRGDRHVQRLKTLIESRRFELAITWLIVLNAVTLGLETSPAIMAQAATTLHLIDHVLLSVFVAELVAKMIVYRLAFFRDPWRIFDLAVVGISLLPASGTLSILRALRVLRVLRLISFIPSMRRVVGGLFSALPSMASIFLLLMLVFYVFAVMATKLYAASFPEMFGNVFASAFTLFQVMTLEGWAGDVVRPVMEVHPNAWMFFMPFILATSFTVLNLFIGIIVSAMQNEHEATMDETQELLKEEQGEILRELRELRHELSELRRQRV